MSSIITKIADMLHGKGKELYGGELVTQAQHALQCATLAEAAKSSDKLITACLLHDIGHLLDDDFERLAAEKDLYHEDLGEAFLSEWFDDEVCQPVKLHVAAKRYFCATNDKYLGKLSAASVQSLKLQGGIMSDEEVKKFRSHPYYQDALRLRVWDDLAKDPDLITPDIAHFMSYVENSLSKDI
ncbi:MAG: hypothetical protein COB24_02520 [Hyphomicrobiales bacterium]|nr:MAG: hypothetical protein COB24_02520 [Hyphomicrobiales bacterium]